MAAYVAPHLLGHTRSDARATTAADGIYQLEHTLTLVQRGRIVVTAVATAWGWHISLGRTLASADPRRPGRCAWWFAPDRATAAQLLRDLRVRLRLHT